MEQDCNGSRNQHSNNHPTANRDDSLLNISQNFQRGTAAHPYSASTYSGVSNYDALNTYNVNNSSTKLMRGVRGRHRGSTLYKRGTGRDTGGSRDGGWPAPYTQEVSASCPNQSISNSAVKVSPIRGRGRGRPRLSTTINSHVSSRSGNQDGEFASNALCNTSSGTSYDTSVYLNSASHSSSLSANQSRIAKGSNSRAVSASARTVSPKDVLIGLWERISSKDTYSFFANPVDPNEVPDYHEVIAQPMDFNTIYRKVVTDSYESIDPLDRDVRLIVSNCKKYNGPETVYYKSVTKVEAHWNKILQKGRTKFEEAVLRHKQLNMESVSTPLAMHAIDPVSGNAVHCADVSRTVFTETANSQVSFNWGRKCGTHAESNAGRLGGSYGTVSAMSRVDTGERDGAINNGFLLNVNHNTVANFPRTGAASASKSSKGLGGLSTVKPLRSRVDGSSNFTKLDVPKGSRRKGACGAGHSNSDYYYRGVCARSSPLISAKSMISQLWSTRTAEVLEKLLPSGANPGSLVSDASLSKIFLDNLCGPPDASPETTKAPADVKLKLQEVFDIINDPTFLGTNSSACINPLLGLWYNSSMIHPFSLLARSWKNSPPPFFSYLPVDELYPIVRQRVQSATENVFADIDSEDDMPPMVFGFTGSASSSSQFQLEDEGGAECEVMGYSDSVRRFVGKENLARISSVYSSINDIIEMYDPAPSIPAATFNDLRLFGLDTEDYMPFNTNLTVDNAYLLGVGDNHIKTAMSLQPLLKEEALPTGSTTTQPNPHLTQGCMAALQLLYYKYKHISRLKRQKGLVDSSNHN